MAENVTVVMNKDDLQPLANNIKTLNGLSQSDLVTLNEMEEAVKDTNDAIDSQENLIAQISAALEGKAGGVGSAESVLQEKTVSPSTSQQNVTPDSGYDGLSKVTVNAMPAGSVANPSISVSNSGLITATTAVNAGYVDGTDKTGTKQLTVQAAQTITPGTSNKTIASGRYLTGTQTIKGDANLVAGNIAKGVSIFGVNGTHEGGAAETCTVTISGGNSSKRPYYVSYMTNEDVPAKVIINNSNLSVTLQNVLCGSVVTVSFYSELGQTLSASTTNAVSIAIRDYKFTAFRITAPSGGTATIKNIDSGGSND